jgi:hypothetical protein
VPGLAAVGVSTGLFSADFGIFNLDEGSEWVKPGYAQIGALGNDLQCFALSEAHDGAAAGYPSMFGVILGTGAGGGYCLHTLRKLTVSFHAA